MKRKIGISAVQGYVETEMDEMPLRDHPPAPVVNVRLMQHSEAGQAQSFSLNMDAAIELHSQLGMAIRHTNGRKHA